MFCYLFHKENVQIRQKSSYKTILIFYPLFDVKFVKNEKP